jgi:type II secretory pathway pseudopilin PulG
MNISTISPQGFGLRRQAQRAAAFSPRRRATAGFTMVEIALCLAIVGFALVAIIGVLPAGLNVQKDNREDTILNQDASVWLDAIRAGGAGPDWGGNYDELTNYVDRIVVQSTPYTVTPTSTNAGATTTLLAQFKPPATVLLTNGAQIIGLLSTPKIVSYPNGSFVSNYVYAYCRAISGAAVEKAPQDNPDVRDLAFSYRMVVELAPVGVTDPEGILTNRVDQVVRNNLTDVRLLFRWPVQRPVVPNQPDPPTGNGRMSLRTELSGGIALMPDAANIPFYYRQPRDYR